MNRTGAFGLGPQTQQTPETPETSTFPEKHYSIVDFGAIGDGFTMNTEAVNLAGGMETSGIEIRGIAGETYEAACAQETDASQIRITPEEARGGNDD